MDILLISEYILVMALILMVFVALRLIAHKSAAAGLLGTSVLSLVLSLFLIIIGDMYSISFCKDIALAILFLGVVGTVGYAVILRGDK